MSRFRNRFPRFAATAFTLLGFSLLGGQSVVVAAQTQPDAQEKGQTQQPQSDDSNQISPETKALHEKLAKYLTATKWTGQFTVAGKPETRTEHYEILTAEKAEIGDYWNLVARIKYGGHDATIPLPPIEIKFAGETPVITVDQAFFPGFGKFDARVLIRKGQYAGTWAHLGGDNQGVGGHMFGTIEKMDPDEAKKKSDEAKKKPASSAADKPPAEKGK